MHNVLVITALFVDIGGVLLTNGWDHGSRKLAAKIFRFDLSEVEERHRIIFDTYEIGKISLDEYLSRAVFYRKRSFTRAQFKKFMFAQSKPYPRMLQLIKTLKGKYGLKIIVVSNEGREINAHRIHKFGLDGFVDAFISSCYVRLRKPDLDIFRLALDVAQAPLKGILYIEDTAMFTDVAESIGIRSLLHTDYESTRAKLAALGLK